MRWLRWGLVVVVWQGALYADRYIMNGTYLHLIVSDGTEQFVWQPGDVLHCERLADTDPMWSLGLQVAFHAREDWLVPDVAMLRHGLLRCPAAGEEEEGAIVYQQLVVIWPFNAAPHYELRDCHPKERGQLSWPAPFRLIQVRY